MAELHIEHIKAMTPQAKGRIERLWKTFQDRLVIELRLLGVKTIEEANEALAKLLDKHNRKFTVAPKEAESAYIPLDPLIDLNHVFTIREYRQLGPGNTLSYNGTIYTLAKPAPFRFDTKMTVEVRETLTGEILLWHQGKALKLKATEKPERKTTTAIKKASSVPPHKPAASHPWRKAWSPKQVQNTRNAVTIQAP